MALDDPTSAEQETAISTVVANGWASESAVRSFVASEGGPRVSVRRILTAFTPNPGAAAVAAGLAVDPGMISTVGLAQGYAQYQAAGKINPGGLYAVPTSAAQTDALGAGSVTAADSRISGSFDFGSGAAGFMGPTAAPEDRASSGAPVPTIINAPGIPTWAIVLGAAVLMFLFMKR